MTRFFIFLLIVIATPFLHTKFDAKPFTFAIDAIGGFAAGMLLESLRKSRENLWMALQLARLQIQGRPLRITFAGLVRIAHGSKYMLVKSSRTGKWQPVGGVYRIYDNQIAAKFGLKDDIALTTVEPPELRKTFPSSRLFNAFKFLEWFDSRLGREVCPNREFHEELVSEKILPAAVFDQPEFEYLRTHTNISFSTYHQCFELKCFEIFDLKASPEQQKVIDQLYQRRDASSPYLFLSQPEIEADGACAGGVQFQVGDQTKFAV